MTNFGNNLRAERAFAGMSRKELAEKSGVCERSVALYEQGKTLPRLDKAKAIADTLGVKLEKLFD